MDDLPARYVTVIDGCAVLTTNTDRHAYVSGHVVVEGNRILAVGSGPAPGYRTVRVADGRGCLTTPGLVNTHHFYQWVSRGLAVDDTLFG